MRVDIEEFDLLMERLRQINGVPLDEIEIFEEGVKIEIDPKSVEEFKFTGLNNRDFIEMRSWENCRWCNGIGSTTEF